MSSDNYHLSQIPYTGQCVQSIDYSRPTVTVAMLAVVQEYNSLLN